MKKLSLILLLVLGLVGSYALPTEAQGSIDIEPPDGWVVTADEGNLAKFSTSSDVELFPRSGEASIRIISDDGKGAWALSPTNDNLVAVAAYQYGINLGLSLLMAQDFGRLPSFGDDPELIEFDNSAGYMLTGQTLSDHIIMVISNPRIMFILDTGLGESSEYTDAFLAVIKQFTGE